MQTAALQASIRFGLGRRPGEALPHDPHAWLAAQLDGDDPALTGAAASAGECLLARQADRAAGPREHAQVRALLAAEQAALLDTAITTDQPFRERLVWFWFNHFTVSLKQPEIDSVAGAYVREAIRPHVNGRFADMLMAVMTHPAMLLYLDNQNSVGPGSPAGLQSHRGLNENLARECLELHTISPAAGYTQADVTAFAAVLTGWSVELNGANPGFVFRPAAHEPGDKTIMRQTFPPGMEGGIAALTWLAGHPATYRHLATKLVRHFVADNPPPECVARIAAVLTGTQGNLKAASLALLTLPQAWQPMTKLRSPFDYLVAALRALALPPEQRTEAVHWLRQLDQPLLAAPLPNGWPDTAADWLSGESLLRRADWAWTVSPRAATADPVQLTQDSLGPLASPDTLEQIRRAASRQEAVTLLLAAPEFMRR